MALNCFSCLIITYKVIQCICLPFLAEMVVTHVAVPFQYLWGFRTPPDVTRKLVVSEGPIVPHLWIPLSVCFVIRKGPGMDSYGYVANSYHKIHSWPSMLDLG